MKTVTRAMIQTDHCHLKPGTLYISKLLMACNTHAGRRIAAVRTGINPDGTYGQINKA
jgi:hypothetical protein